MKIGYINNTLTFYYCFHKHQLDEAGWTDIPNLDITDGGSATMITQQREFDFGLGC